MKSAPWLRFKSWAAGVADFNSCGGDIKSNIQGLPKTLEVLLKRKEWRGAKVSHYFDRGNEMLHIVHPTGAETRIRADVFADLQRGAA